MERLLNSVEQVANTVRGKAEFEVLFINDSPGVDVVLPDYNYNGFDIRVYNNEVNMGIQKTRAKGANLACGQWIIFLDQDDELISEGFINHIRLMKNADVVVGNGLYQYADKKVRIYENLRTMQYLIRKKMLIEIRNLIPSPGECLIRKDTIPKALSAISSLE